MRFLLLLPTLLLAACVSAPRTSRELDEAAKRFDAPPADTGMIYIYRDGSYARLWQSQVSLIGSVSTQLPADTFLLLPIQPGPTEISCLTADLADRHQIKVAAGEIRYFEVTVRSGLYSPYCLVTEVSSGHAQALIRQKRRVEAI